MNIFAKIKKQNGESFAKVLRDYHNGIFEIPGILDIVKFAGKSAQDAEGILSYLVSLINADEIVTPESIEDPFVLLDRAGYNAFYADTLEKQNSIKKHFAPGEELCTFTDSSRFKHYYIINAVKKNVDTIIRKNFNGIEQREDEYGTSVISIQIGKAGGFISIKNRYNHTVSGCDNTFKSDPNNIIDGLSESIQKYFNVSFSSKANNLLPEKCMLVNKCLFKYHDEISGIFFGDHAYIKNGTLHEVSAQNHEYLFDYFIFDARSKTFRIVPECILDSFADDYNAVYGGKKSVYVKNHCIYDGDIMLVGC